MPKLNGFVGGSSVSVSPEQDCERTMNFYVEPGPKSGKNSGALYPMPGFISWSTVSQVGARALYEMNGTMLGVLGGTQYGFASLGTATSLGSVTQDSNQAQIVSNGAVGAQFLTASGTNGYCYTPASSAFTQVLTGDCVMVGMLDGYGIALNPVTSRIRLSNLNDFTTWSGTQFAARGDAPDNWVAMVVNIPDVWLIGQQTGVVWYDAGNFPFPLAPRPGATFKYGIVAPWTLKTAGGYVLWLSRNAEGAGIVVQAVGYSPQRVSTYEVETAIASYARNFSITDAESLMFQYQGHTFYVLTFPSANATWMMDVTTGIWTELGKWNSPMTRYDIWQPRVHCYAFGQHIVGDRATGQLSLMDGAYQSEADGSLMRRMRITPAVFNENRQIPHRRLEVMMEHGLGTQTGQGINPLLSVEYSDDGGKTYSPPLTMAAGKVGEYPKRTYLTRLGVPRNRVYRFVMTDPIPWRLIDCYINNDAPQQAGRAA